MVFTTSGRNEISTAIRSKLILALAITVAANAADLASTYLASPDLANEWNVLHSRFGLGWGGLIVAKLIGGALALAGYAYYLRHRDGCYPRPGLDRQTFCRHFSFGRSVTWLEMAAGIPVGKHLGVNLGYFWAGMQLLIFWVAADNVLLHYGWVFPLRHTSELGYHLLQSGLVGFLVLARFYFGNYARYRSLSEIAVAPAPIAQHSAA